MPLIFNVDQKAPFESFMLVLDEAKSQEKQKFYINGQPKGDSAVGDLKAVGTAEIQTTTAEATAGQPTATEAAAGPSVAAGPTRSAEAPAAQTMTAGPQANVAEATE